MQNMAPWKTEVVGHKLSWAGHMQQNTAAALSNNERLIQVIHHKKWRY